MGKSWSSMASHGDDFTPPVNPHPPTNVGSTADNVHPVGPIVGKSGDDVNGNTAKNFDDYLDTKLPRAREEPISPVGATTKATEKEKVASFVIENTCAEVAGKMLDQIHEFRENCVSQVLSATINELLNKKLEERKRVQQTQQTATTLAKTKGSCASEVYKAGVEWVVKGATSNTLDNFSVTSSNSTFQTNCQSCIKCIANYNDVTLDISLYSTNSLIRSNTLPSSTSVLRTSSTPRIASIPSSPSVSSSSSLSLENNSALLTTSLLMLFLIYFINWKKN